MSSANKDFSSLLAAAKRGDAHARGALVEQFVPGVLARVRKGLSPALRRRYDSIDVVQSVTADLLGSLPRMEDRGAGAFRRWIQVAAENKIRSKGRKMRTNTGALRETAVPDAARRPAKQPTPSQTAASHDDLGKLLGKLGTLDATSREVIRLRLREGKSYREIAEIVGAPSENAARMRFERAVAKLRSKWTRP